jgi:RNA polymerase sigma-70 factor, ECF subfamily
MDTVGAEVTVGDALVRSAAMGDEAAFARLVADHHAALARVAFVICGDAELTGDAVQTAWSIAWRRIGSLRDPSRVRAWLVAIAANEARKLARQRRRATIVDISAALADADDGDPVASLDLIDLAMALRGLRPDERALLALRYVAGLDSREIAVALRLSPSGVRSRLSRIVERLRVDLAVPAEGEE